VLTGNVGETKVAGCLEIRDPNFRFEKILSPLHNEKSPRDDTFNVTRSQPLTVL